MPRGIPGSGKAATRAKSTTTPAATETAAPETSASPDAKPPIKRRGRRKAQAPAPVSETMRLVETVLRSRGARGATQEALQSVITWARSIRTEGESLQEFSVSTRRQKLPPPTERVARYEMNLSLLDGILSGAITLDVQDNGDFVFLHSALTNPAPTATAEDTAGIPQLIENVTGDVSG